MAASAKRRKLVANLGAQTRFHPERDTTDLRREIAAAKLEDAIREVVDKFPPLSPAQRDRLAGLLRPTSGGGA